MYHRNGEQTASSLRSGHLTVVFSAAENRAWNALLEASITSTGGLRMSGTILKINNNKISY